MSLAPGVRLGAYEVIALLGAGGMGREIVFGNLDGRMMTASITTYGKRFSVGPARHLFTVRPGGPRSFFDITPGMRFLVNAAPERSDSMPITLVMNWHAELRK